MKRRKKHISIRYSCLTGKAVWVNVGFASDPRMSYWRACKHELEYVRSFAERMARRKESVKAMLGACLANLPINAELSEEKRKAAKRLLAIAEEKVPLYTGFYDHIMEEARRRNNTSKRWTEARSKKFGI